MPNQIAILDAGSQFGKLIDRRLHELGIKCELLPLNANPKDLTDYPAAVISGSPGSVNEPNSPSLHPDFFDEKIGYKGPVLGICYGLQLVNKLFGGSIQSLDNREDGQFEIEIISHGESVEDVSENDSMDQKDVNQLVKSNLFEGFDCDRFEALLTHGDQITKVGDELKIIGKAGNVVTAIQHKSRPIYGVQFHPEVELTPRGKDLFNNFITKISKLQLDYTIKDREERILKEIRDAIGDQQVVILVSGGVDSSVLTALCQKALGKEKANKQLQALHFDNGFMRKDESAKVYEMLSKLGVKLQVIHAQDRFYCGRTKVKMRNCSGQRDVLQETDQLCEVHDPEQKRKIIGDTFMRVAHGEIIARNIDWDNCFIAQGTLRPDLIESASSLASSNAETIKTHHNDSQLVRELRKTGRVLEPLKDFHKDEVRQLGRDLGLGEEFVDRHPFPGPGLAIRIICHNSQNNNDPVKEVTAKASEENTASMIKTFVRYADANAQPNEVFLKLQEKLNPRDRQVLLDITTRLPKLSAVMLPFRTVGVQGDGRTYKLCAAISCNREEAKGQIDTSEFWQDMYKLAKILPSVAKFINRVVFVFTDKRIDETPEFTTHTLLTKQVIQQLQEADNICTEALRKHNAYHKIAQMPVVLVPVDFPANDPTKFGYGYLEKKQCHPVLRSICIRPFLSSDFMTGLPALPVKDIPLDCINEMVDRIGQEVYGISNVMIDLTPKPPGTTEWE